MARHAAPEILDVTAENVEKTGFFCYMSKKKSEGYRRKLEWLKGRFTEGLRLKMLALPERGFIEYIPGEQAWRAVHADGYLLIHCLWVVGKSKGHGFASALLEECVAEARQRKLRGVAAVASEKVWMAGPGVFEKHGFKRVDTASPAFTLLVKSFADHPLPRFAGKWEEKARALGKGLTIVRSDQCPYIVDATATAVAAAEKAGVRSRVVQLESREDLLRYSPSPYGVFGLVLDGRMLSYHYLLEKDLLPLLRGA